MSAEIHVGDIGARFQATIKDETGAVVDVSTAVTLEMVFSKPNETPILKTAEHLTDGTDGVIYYDSVDGDLDQAGGWRVQGYAALDADHVFHSDIHVFRVYPNLPRPTP